MDKRDKKGLLREWRDQRRAAARYALPLPPEEMKALFASLYAALPTYPCDHSRRHTDRWLQDTGHDMESVLAWLDDNGGFCDCEVLLNCEPAFEDAMRGE